MNYRNKIIYIYGAGAQHLPKFPGKEVILNPLGGCYHFLVLLVGYPTFPPRLDKYCAHSV